MDMPMVVYKGTDKVKVVNKNNLNRRYKHLFHQKLNILVKFFNFFNYLVNDMCRINMKKKTRKSLVLKFLDSLNDSSEYHVDIIRIVRSHSRVS